MSKRVAIAFDFDGTLIRGRLDKGIHIMYSSWVACYDTGFRRFLHAQAPEEDMGKLVRAYLHYAGAPRFQQLSSIVNCLVNDCADSVSSPAELGVEPELQRQYEQVRERYNSLFSALNDAAAGRHWHPHATLAAALRTLAKDYDLWIASGITEDIVQKDVDRHGLERALFMGIRGGNPQGGADKAELLREIRARGYGDVLFVGDWDKDREYAAAAGARFFRVRGAADFPRLIEALKHGLPDENEPWDLSDEDLAFLREKALHLIECYGSGKPLSPEAATDWVNA